METRQPNPNNAKTINQPLLTVASEFWEEQKVHDIVHIFSGSYHIHTKKVERLSLQVDDPILWLVVSLGGAVITGIGKAIGEDIWKEFKKRFIEHTQDKPSSLRVMIDSNARKVEFNLGASNPEVVKLALESVDKAVESLLSKDNASIYLNFDEEKSSWKQVNEDKFAKIYTGIMATKNKIVKNGITIQLNENDFQQIIKNATGSYVNLNHSSLTIGKVIRAWIDGDVVKFEVGIFQGLPKDVMDRIDEAHGVSMEFFHNPKDPPQNN